MSSEASQQLAKLIDWISNSSLDPWPRGKVDPTPLDPNSEAIDPTQNFSDVSDEWTNDDDEDGNSQVSKQDRLRPVSTFF